MNPAETYQLLRSFTTPVAAITSAKDGKRNGMISDAVIRASIVPEIPRLAVFIHKFNYSHELIFDAGCFVAHLLHQEQLDLVWKLGFASGRDRDKLADIPHRLGSHGCPVLDDCYAFFECTVVNAMDTGSSTCFLGEAVSVGRGPGREMLTPAYLRSNLPEEWRETYLRNLALAQDAGRKTARQIRPLVWRGLAS